MPKRKIQIQPKLLYKIISALIFAYVCTNAYDCIDGLGFVKSVRCI